MKNYKKLILETLIDKYEKSSLYRGDNKVNVNINFKFSKKSISDYYDEQDYTLKREINEQALNLEEEGFVKIQWKKFQEGNIIDKLHLNIENLNDIYKCLRRQPKTKLEDNAQDIISIYCNRKDWLGTFAADMTDKLNVKKSIKKYLSIEEKQEIKDILYAIDRILAQQHEIPKRVLSVKLFSNSKRLEQLESKILRIMKDYGNYDGIDILAEENIIHNPSYVFLKGNGKFVCNAETIDLGKIQGDIGLSISLIDNLQVERLDVKHIITIENLTTFHCYQPKDELVIYLGGYHNSSRRKLLKKIYQYNIRLVFYHWGDIDLGGLRILNHLRKKTNISFIPYRMDKKTLEANIDYGKKIDNKNYLNELQKLLFNNDYKEFYEVINYMINNKVTLEQEAIEIE